jgi:hypothetical protein
MWPYLFGSGWQWNVLASAGVLAIGVVAVAAALRDPGRGAVACGETD